MKCESIRRVWGIQYPWTPRKYVIALAMPIASKFSNELNSKNSSFIVLELLIKWT